MKTDYLTAAKAFLNETHSKAKSAFIAGSVTRGEQTATSDIDLVIVYDTDTLPKAYRHFLIYRDWPIESFVQNFSSLQYFREQDKKCGMPALLHMIAEGIVWPQDNDCALNLQNEARRTLAAGPEALSIEAITGRRYSLTDILDDIEAYKNTAELYGSLCQLYQNLGDFYLRANKCWSGSSKALPRAIKKAFPDLLPEYESAFKEGFAGNIRPVLELADKLLAPFGGKLRAEWLSYAPDEANKLQPPSL